MRHLKLLTILPAVLFINVTIAQSVEEIIAKHIDAIGGKEKLTQVNSVSIESTVQAMGNESPVKVSMLNGKGIKTEFEMMGSQVVQVYTDKGGWMINPLAGASAATAMPDDVYKSGEDQVYFNGPLVNYAANGGKAELQGQEKVGDINAYKIKYTNKDGSETIFYIDPITYYLVQTSKIVSMMGQDVDMTVTYSDFRKTDNGIVYPYGSEINYGSQFSMTMTVKKIELNTQIDPAIFDMPK